MLVEVCVNSLESALNAQQGGADRVELCVELGVGGITPSYGLLKAVRKELRIPVHVLIRPRSGDFSYSDTEFEIMQSNIALCKEMGFEGVVSGILHHDFSLDEARTQSLIDLARPLNFTFHRAFDWVVDPEGVFLKLQQMGADYVLSSGQAASALAGLPLLQRLQEHSTTCIVMPGGGVRVSNVNQLKELQFKAVHSSGSKLIRTLTDLPKIGMYSPSFLKDEIQTLTGEESIRELVQIVKK